MISILNVRITPTTGLELLSNIKKGILVTPNVDHLVKLQKNRAFYNAYQEATHVICDSRISEQPYRRWCPLAIVPH